MEKVLTNFVGRLRQAGLSVSPAEAIDAFAALSHVGLAERSRFKDALRTSLIKRGRDIPVFDALFDLCFTGTAVPDSPAGEPEESTPREDVSSHLAEMLEMQQPDLSLVTEMIIKGQFGPLTKLLWGNSRDLGLNRLESPLQLNFFLRRLRNELDLDRVHREAEDFLQEVESSGLDPEYVKIMRDQIARNLRRAESEVRRLLENELAQNRFLFLRRIEEEDQGERNLAQLTDAEVLEMRPAVERLARRLKERLSVRLKHGEEGRFDIKTTLRQNIGYGGLLPELSFRKKRPNKPQLIALCDVSRSVRNFSRFMLLFLYTLKEVVAKVRSFIFVGDIAEVTDLFRTHDVGEAVTMAAAARSLTYVFRTDYGAVFSQFAQEHLNIVNSKTTIFILGDARNNFYHPHGEALAEMAGRARKLIWLNPEPPPNWRIGDSVMELYRPYCTVVAQCGNLNQLSTVIEENLIP